MRRLVPCPQCKRHVFAAETTCPHCGKSAGAATIAALAVSAGLALAACEPTPEPLAVYGPPPVNPSARQEAPTAQPTTSASASPSTAPQQPTAPVAVYGPAPVRPEDRQPQPTAAPGASSAPTAQPKPAPKK
jgi:hypothetical protein